MATDGTGIKVLVPGLPATHDGYVELYRNAECAVFQYAAHKGGDDVEAKLASFRGTLTADAEHRFNGVYATGRVIEAGCNAHGRRKFRDAEATQPVLAREASAFVAAMYVAEAQAQNEGLTGATLLAHRREHNHPILTRDDQVPSSVGAQVRPDPNAASRERPGSALPRIPLADEPALLRRRVAGAEQTRAGFRRAVWGGHGPRPQDPTRASASLRTALVELLAQLND